RPWDVSPMKAVSLDARVPKGLTKHQLRPRVAHSNRCHHSRTRRLVGDVHWFSVQLACRAARSWRPRASASLGGTALPIWANLWVRAPAKRKRSGKLCKRAASRTEIVRD